MKQPRLTYSSPLPSRLALLGLATALALLALAAPAVAQAPTPPPQYPAAPDLPEVDAREAFRIAEDAPDVAEVTAERGQLAARMERQDDGDWQVGFFTDGYEDEVVQIHVSSATGEILESWTGDQVAWSMARGYEGQFGHALNAPYVWIPLALLFFLGLLDWRRPFRIVHLDLLVLLSFGLSHIFFNQGEIGLSAPLTYPPLLYLLGRMLWIGFRGGGSPLRPSAPRLFLVIAVLFLIAFRITLNATDSGVIDVGYAGVVGADRITQGEAIYGEGNFPREVGSGDTYGPANYLAYVPFELTQPWSGEWDDLPAAHAAATFFDLAAVLGLFVLGLRFAGGGDRGRRLGLILAFAWLAYPYTLFAMQSNSNDSLVGALLIWGLVLLASPVGRGTMVALAALTKFAPLALVPLYAAGTKASRRGVAITAGTAAFTVALLMIWPAIDPGLASFYERTIGSQLGRDDSPFSIWGQVDGIEWAQKTVLVLAAALALVVAIRPRGERSTAQVAALAAAVLIAAQLAIDHWFYLYIPWFCGLVFVALATGSDRPRTRPSTP